MSRSVSSSTTSSSFRSDLSALREQISIPALESVARRHAQAEHVTIQSPPKRGGYNLVYPMSFSDGRKWIARIPDPKNFDPVAMQSTVHTIRMIQEKTSIPIPAIHAYDISPNNELGMPYTLMEFVEGVLLIDIWKDEKVVDDTARRRIFEQVAGYMSQLKALEFDKIGTLRFDDESGAYTVGPFARTERAVSPRSIQIAEECGPFTTTHAFLSHAAQWLINSCIPTHRPHFLLLRMLALSLPDPQYDGPPFVLSHPDLDSQNVLVDPKSFTITAFIDWDGVEVTSPRLAGFARYPAWITRDWDPLGYWWRKPQAAEAPSSSRDESAEESGSDGSGGYGSRSDKGSGESGGDESSDGGSDWFRSQSGGSHSDDEATRDSPSAQEDPFSIPPSRMSEGSSAASFVEESPDALQRHRDLYLSIYSSIDPHNAGITRQSHIFEALNIALHDPVRAHEIVNKLCRDFVFESQLFNDGDLVDGLRDGDWMRSLHLGLEAPDGRAC